MKLENMGHQGDTQWFNMPEGVDFSSLKKLDQKHFIVKSERHGSVHALCGDYEMFTAPEPLDGFVIKTNSKCILNHTFESNIVGDALDRAEVLPVKDHPYSEIPANKVVFVGIHRKADPLSGFYKKVED